ncbi:hypothetical protein TIFTF001_005444 [Ficus carica]|uniref:Uncharacterized protein n=1 Tax=Ficus carica TaxID=3494 RepID=A0AA87ZG54_FICCA|nr:hypothetical protein TIFTF001_005444 [Ficus carica]
MTVTDGKQGTPLQLFGCCSVRTPKQTANELSVLCDAKVSVIILSGTGKLHEYTSDSTSTKEIIDIYQRALRTDIWSSQYEKMQEHLKKLKEKNRSLRMQISRRMGECLNGLDFKELYELEQEMQDAVNNIRERKFKRAKQNINYLTDGIKDDPDYGLVEGPGGHYDSIAGAYPNGIPGILALGLQLNQPNYS